MFVGFLIVISCRWMVNTSPCGCIKEGYFCRFLVVLYLVGYKEKGFLQVLTDVFKYVDLNTLMFVFLPVVHA